jgi:hypothetical protein
MRANKEREMKDVCSSINAMKRGTPLSGADPSKRGVAHSEVYGQRRTKEQRSTGGMTGSITITRAAPGDPDPHRAAHLAGELK